MAEETVKKRGRKPKVETDAQKTTNTIKTTKTRATVKKSPVKVVEKVEESSVEKIVEQPKEKRKNVAIEFWRIFFVIAIIGYSVGTIMASSTVTGADGYWMKGSNWFAGAGEVLFVFALTAGYFMVSHFKKLQQDKNYIEKSASGRAWEYVWGRIKNLVPVLIFAYLFGLIISKFYFGYAWCDVFNITINNLWTFLGFNAAGLSGVASAMVGNNALWFISALLLCSYFLYWGLCKNEDKTCGLVVPFIFIFLGGWWCITGTDALNLGWSGFGAQTTNVATGISFGTGSFGLNNGLLFVLLGMCGGILIYYLVEKIKKHKFSAEGKAFLTFLYVVVAGFLVWYVLYPDTTLHLESWTVYLLCMVLVTLTLLGVDGVSKILNNRTTYDFFKFLGEMALYLYMVHYPVILMVLLIAGKNNPGSIYTPAQIFWPTLILSFIFGIMVKLFMDTAKQK